MKKIYCVIFSVMLVVFTMIPVTAFAYTGAANADYKSIAESNDILIADNMKYYVVYTQRGATDYVYCAFSDNPIKFVHDDRHGYSIANNGSTTNITLVRYSYQNIYDNPEALIENRGLGTSPYFIYYLNPCSGAFYDDTGTNQGVSVPLIPAYCNYDFDNAGKTFTQTPSTSTTPGTEGETTTPGAVVLGATLKKTQLSQVLSELIAVLPILLPVLITFIAIRKGIKFILGTLRTA